MFDRAMLQDLLFYARLYKERYSPVTQLEAVIEETEELKDAVIEWLESYKDKPVTGMNIRTTYENIVEETWDVFIMCLAIMLIFDDPPMWLMKFHEKVRQWREALEVDI